MEVARSNLESVPLPKGDLKISDILDDIDRLIAEDSDSNARLRQYLQEIKHINGEIEVSKEEDLQYIIQKHPYFKNPCKYPIRLISIMKYLKRKGVDISESELDIKIDGIISGMPEVKRIEFGRYKIIGA